MRVIRSRQRLLSLKKGDPVADNFKKPQQPWAMLSFMVNVVRLVLLFINHPPS